MAAYAYLRVSTDLQDVDNQRHGILEYAHKKGIANLSFIEDTVSGKKKWRERKLGDLVEHTMKTGDLLLVSEISRIARSTLQVLDVLEVSAERALELHIAKQNLVFAGEGDMTSQILATVLGMVAQIEREFVSQRTKESLASKKRQLEDQGFFLNKEGEKVYSLGRPSGKAQRVKLDDYDAQIRDLLQKGVNKRAISKIVGCAPSTLYDWIKRRKIRIVEAYVIRPPAA